MKCKSFNRRILGFTVGAILGINILSSNITAFASDVDIIFSKECDSVIINNISSDISSNIIGVQINIDVDKTLSDINFSETSDDHTGFATYDKSSSTLSINLASDTDLRGSNDNQTSYIDLGDLKVGELDFDDLFSSGSLGSITLIDFLYNEITLKNITVDIVANLDDILNPNTNSGDGESSNSNANNNSNTNSNSSSNYDDDDYYNSYTSSNTSSGSNQDDNNNEETETEEFHEISESQNPYIVKLSDFEINKYLSNFIDMDTTWSREVVAYCIKHNFFAGVSENEFAPNDNMTRAMFVTVLSRVEGIGEYIYNNEFLDVPDKLWYSNAVSWCVEHGITSGIGDDLFGTNDNITREQMAVLLYNYVNKFNIKLNFKESKTAFVDEELISGYALEAVSTMAHAGILNGKGDNEFDPKGNATRAEVSAMIYAFLNNIYK